MPRHPGLFLPGATYHVYCRVARGEFVFDDPLEAEAFVSAVREVRDLHGWRVFAWTLHGESLSLGPQNRRSRSVEVNAGLQLERTDGEFRFRLDSLDQAISDPATANASMRYVAPGTMELALE